MRVVLFTSLLLTPSLALADVAPGGCRCDSGAGIALWLIPVLSGLVLALRSR